MTTYTRRRGQMTAPIELFIAVIIMAISLGIAFSYMERFDNVQCELRVKTQNERLQEKMQEVAIGSWGTSKVVDYIMERCPVQNTEAVRIVHYSDPKYCGSCAGNYGGGCWIIEPLTYSNSDNKLSPIDDAKVCIELSESLKLSIDHSADCNGVVTENSACPTQINGNPVSASDCEKMTYSAAGQFDNAELATFERKTQSAVSFNIRITKGASSGDITAKAGELVLCVSQPK